MNKNFDTDKKLESLSTEKGKGIWDYQKGPFCKTNAIEIACLHQCVLHMQLWNEDETLSLNT